MDEVLEELNLTPGVQGSLIVGKDGLVITSSGNAEPDPDFLGAETAEIFQNVEAGMSEKFERGMVNLISLEGQSGSIFLKSINEVTYLMVLAEDSAGVGMVRHSIEMASGKLKEQL